MIKKTFILLLIISASKVGIAQTSFKVIDEQGKIVNNALVSVKSLNENTTDYILTSDSAWTYTKVSPPFQVSITAYGFQKKIDTCTSSNSIITLKRNFTTITKTVITGQPSEIAVENSADRVRTISKSKIRNLAAVNLVEALANEVNVTVNEDANLGSSISLRGIAGQQLKILVDGVPMIGRNDGMLDLSQINTSNIERIEIIEGPMSIVYGTDASGGVINVITSQPKKNEQKLSASQFAATNGTFNSFISYSKGTKKNQFAINATRMIFQGFDEDKNKRNPLWRPKRQMIGDLFFQHYFNKNVKQNIRINYFNEYLIAKGTPITTPISAIGIDDYFKTNRFNVSTQTYIKFTNSKTRLNLTNAYNLYHRNRNRVITNLETLEENTATASDALDTQTFQLFNSRLLALSRINKYLNLGYGFDISIENARSARVLGNNGVSDLAAFYNLKLNYKKLMIEQGLRFTYNNQFNVPLIPAIHAKYKFSERWNARLSASNGFRSPSIKERYLYFVDQNHDVTGNPDLLAESSSSIIAGVNHTKELSKYDLNIDASIFRTTISDMIVLAATNNTATSFQYENVEMFTSQGVNVNLNYGRKRFDIRTGAGYIGIRQQTDSLNGSDEFLYRFSAQANITYKLEKLKTHISFLNKYNGSIPNYYKENNTLKLQYSTPFMISDLSVMRKFAADKVTMVLTAKNLFNIRQIQNVNTIGGVHNPGTNSANVAMGRYFSLNLFIDLK